MMNEPVSTIMTKNLITAQADDKVSTVYNILRKHRIHHVPIVEGEDLVGLLTTYDLFKHKNDTASFDSIAARDMMTTKLAVLEPDAKVGTASEIFLEHLFHAIPIVQGKKLVGIVTTHDLLKYSFRKAYPKDPALQRK